MLVLHHIYYNKSYSKRLNFVYAVIEWLTDRIAQHIKKNTTRIQILNGKPNIKLNIFAKKVISIVQSCSDRQIKCMIVLYRLRSYHDFIFISKHTCSIFLGQSICKAKIKFQIRKEYEQDKCWQIAAYLSTKILNNCKKREYAKEWNELKNNITSWPQNKQKIFCWFSGMKFYCCFKNIFLWVWYI